MRLRYERVKICSMQSVCLNINEVKCVNKLDIHLSYCTSKQGFGDHSAMTSRKKGFQVGQHTFLNINKVCCFLSLFLCLFLLVISSSHFLFKNSFPPFDHKGTDKKIQLNAPSVIWYSPLLSLSISISFSPCVWPSHFPSPLLSLTHSSHPASLLCSTPSLTLRFRLAKARNPVQPAAGMSCLSCSVCVCVCVSEVGEAGAAF